jgi:hypothetical protein
MSTRFSATARSSASNRVRSASSIVTPPRCVSVRASCTEEYGSDEGSVQ